MKRYYYIIDDLDELELIEIELLESGIDPFQFHIYSSSEKSAELFAHDLHPISDFSKLNVVRSSLYGLGLGCLVALLTLLSFYQLGWVEPPLGWVPAIFLSMVLLGFCLWEGGLKGIQETNHELLPFKNTLNQGKHIFYIDISAHEENILEELVAAHPNMQFAGYGHAASKWFIQGQNQLQRFIKSMP